MKSLLKRFAPLIIVYLLIISTALVSSSDSMNAGKSQQAQNMPASCSYNSSYNNSSISFVSSSKISQAQSTISVGNGYYSSHPISYGSEIGSQTWIKDGHSSASMERDISYAQGINGQAEVAASDSSHSIDGVKLRGSSVTHIKVDENIVGGQTHIGVLQGSDTSGEGSDASEMSYSGADSLIEAWKKPAMEIDEDYIGTFHIYKNMTIRTTYNQDRRNDSWLDFRSGGYSANYWPYPTSVNADSFFNCKAANPSKIF